MKNVKLLFVLLPALLSGCVSLNTCENIFTSERYIGLPKHKAIYMNERAGRCYNEGGYPSPEDAVRIVYDNCTKTNGPGCELWALDNNWSDYALARERDFEDRARKMEETSLAIFAATPALISAANASNGTFPTAAWPVYPNMTSGGVQQQIHNNSQVTQDIQCSLQVGNASLYPLLAEKELGLSFVGVSNCPDSVDFTVRLEWVETYNDGGRHQRVHRVNDHAPNERINGQTQIIGNSQRFEVRNGTPRISADFKPFITGATVETCRCAGPSVRGLPTSGAQ